MELGLLLLKPKLGTSYIIKNTNKIYSQKGPPELTIRTEQSAATCHW